ncbi:TIR domain-containing protein [Geodermatophilus sp. URMC 60]
MSGQGGQAVSIFISYRREGGFYLAKKIYGHLKQCGYDVSMDIQQLGAGKFENITLEQIGSRDYFIIVLTKGSLDRLHDPDDWLRKEILTARNATRTIIPVFDVDFSFEASDVRDVLAAAPKAIREIAGFNAVRMSLPEYFEDGLKRLRRFLLEKQPAVTASPTPSEGLREAERHLDKHVVPSPRTLTTEGRTARSWNELEDRLSDDSQPVTETKTEAVEQLGHDQAPTGSPAIAARGAENRPGEDDQQATQDDVRDAPSVEVEQETDERADAEVGRPPERPSLLVLILSGLVTLLISVAIPGFYSGGFMAIPLAVGVGVPLLVAAILLWPRRRTRGTALAFGLVVGSALSLTGPVAGLAADGLKFGFSAHGPLDFFSILAWGFTATAAVVIITRPPPRQECPFVVT